MTQKKNTQEVLSLLKNNFSSLIYSIDNNKDGKISRDELMGLLLSNGIDSTTAQAMVSEVFAKLDKNGDGQISQEEAAGSGESVTHYFNKISLVSPADGVTFYHYPRKTLVSWVPVACAQQYKIDIEFQSCGEWYPYINQHSKPTFFIFDFIGSQLGRWRITALDVDGQVLAQSSYWHFGYQI